jgi:hypothetical protein
MAALQQMFPTTYVANWRPFKYIKLIRLFDYLNLVDV